MEMLIQIIDQLQIQTANPSLNTKPVNAKPAAPGQKCFKSTLNKALGTDSSTVRQSESAPSDTENSEPTKAVKMTEDAPMTAMVTPLVVSPVAVMELLQEAAQETATQASQSAVPGGSNTAEQPVSVAMLAENTPQGAAFTLAQNSNPASGEEVGVSVAQALTTKQNIPLAADEQGQTPVTPQIETPPLINKPAANQAANQSASQATPYIANNTPNAGLATETVNTANLVNGTVANPSPRAQSVQDSEQTVGDRMGVVIPVAMAKEQLSDSADSNTADTTADQSVMTPLTLTQTVKQDIPVMSLPAEEISPPVKEQVLQAIVQKARLISDGTQQQMQIQLKPEHLGTLNVQIAVENGAVTAKFLTDNPQVKQALEASFNQLKQDLQAQGFKVQDVAVSVAQQGMSFSEFSRRSPQFELIKGKRLGKVGNEVTEQTATVDPSLLENYGGILTGEVDYKV